MKKPIKTVVRCPEDLVLVFDQDGEEMPEYRGQYQVLREKVLNDAPPNAVFAYMSYSEPELHKVPRHEW